MPYNSLLWWRAFALLSTWKELGVQFLGATGSPGGREEVMYLGPSWENTKRKIPGGPWLGRVLEKRMCIGILSWQRCVS